MGEVQATCLTIGIDIIAIFLILIWCELRHFLQDIKKENRCG